MTAGRDQDADRGGPWPFTTWAVVPHPDGGIERQTSRWLRKHRSSLEGSGDGTWWAPRALGWWIGVLFAIGSICFAVGAMPGFVEAVGTTTDGITFFVGSLFFTTAGFLQYLQAANAPDVRHAGGDTRRPGRWRVLTLQPHRIDWWATVVQFAGTLFFNVNTFHALSTSIDSGAFDQRVWRPDALGSICFLVASGLAWAEVCHGWFGWRPADLEWRITALNLVGSIFFGISAIASYVLPSTGDLVDLQWTNLGTFLGALCFLAGALLLLPERTQERAGT